MQSFQGVKILNLCNPPALPICFRLAYWHHGTSVVPHQHSRSTAHWDTGSLTSKTIRHICFKHNVAENCWKREWFVALIPKGNMSVTCLQTIQRQDPLTNQLIIVIIHCYSQDSKIREDNLESHKMKKFNYSNTVASSPTPMFEPLTLYARNRLSLL